MKKNGIKENVLLGLNSTFIYKFVRSIHINNIILFAMKNTNTIKSIIILSLLMISSFIALNSTAQDTSSGDNYVPQSDYRLLRLGITSGMGFAWMKPKTDGYEKNGSTFTYNYGIIIDYNFTKNYTFSSGLSFNQLGGKLHYANDTSIVGSVPHNGVLERKYQINSLELPTLLKLKTNQMGYLTYFAQIGLKHNFQLSSFADDVVTYGNETKATQDIDMADNTSFYRISFNAGLGAEYAISQTFSAFAYLEYDNGLSNSLSNEKTNSDGKIISKKEKAFIKKFAITFGFLF